MADISQFNPNSAGNPNYNIFGLPFTEEESRVIILPVPWEVSVSYGVGTARSTKHIFKASLQVDLFDSEAPDAWRQGYFMREYDRKILLKSDYLRKEAELYIDYISKGDLVEANQFMSKTLKEVNEGGIFLNAWVYEQAKDLLHKNKLIGLLGGDHSAPLGLFKAIGEKHNDFGILQIDAHADLRVAYEGFKYSHASIMYNALTEIPQLKKLVQVGIRDYSDDELSMIENSDGRIVTFFDKDIKRRQYEGDTWKHIVDEIVNELPQKVHISFDIDGLDPKLCPNTGTPVAGGFEVEQVYYLVEKMIKSGRQLVGFDLNEIGIGENNWDANVGARILYKLCNFLVLSNKA
jgi:agmatinase